MPLVLIGFLAFFLLAWWWRRGRSLTRSCRWREDRRLAPPGGTYFHCLACGAETRLAKGQEPRHCLRAAAPTSQSDGPRPDDRP